MSKNFISENLYQKIISLIPISCVDLVIKKNDSFLLVKRLENPAKNQWWFPGGRILFNESRQQAVKRKLKEELNIKNPQRIKFLGVGETKFKKGKFNKPIHTINNVFLVELTKKESTGIRSDPTIAQCKWFNSIQKGFHPYLKKFLKLAGFK
jgi:colanic acid biosynthesis protein WcaH